MYDYALRDAPFRVLVMHNMRGYSPTVYGCVISHQLTNRAGDILTFTTRHHDRSTANRVSGAKIFFLRVDARYSAKRSHGGGDGDFNSKAALLRLPETSPLWEIPIDNFEQRWFYETIRAPIVYHRYHKSHRTTTAFCAPPPEHLAAAIEHHYGIGSVAYPTDVAKATLDGELTMRKLGLKHERIVFTASSNVADVDYEYEILRRPS